MRPELIHIGDTLIPVYGISFAFSVILGILLCYRRAKIEKLHLEHYTKAVFWGLVGLIVMSKLLHVATSWELYADNLGGILDLRSGHAFYGGVIGGIGFPVVYIYLVRERYLPILDIWMTYTALGLAIHRMVGCLGAGCCYGAPTGLPWGITFPESAPASLHFGEVPVHPTQIYESLVFWIIFAAMLVWRARYRKVPGELFMIWLVLCAIGKFTVEIFRGDDRRGDLAGLSMAQWISIGMLVAAAGLGSYLMARRREKAEAGVTE